MMTILISQVCSSTLRPIIKDLRLGCSLVNTSVIIGKKRIKRTRITATMMRVKTLLDQIHARKQMNVMVRDIAPLVDIAKEKVDVKLKMCQISIRCR